MTLTSNIQRRISNEKGGSRWSRFPDYLKAPGAWWPWLRVERLFGEWGIAKELKLRRLGPEQLARLGKAQPGKVAAAQRLRRETTMTWDWIAQRLAMVVCPYAASCVRRLSKSAEYTVLRD